MATIKDLQNRVATINKKLVKELELIRGGISTRTEAGKDAENRSFRPYSQNYAAKRQARGYSTTPNLTITGRMLGSMNVKEQRGQAAIAISGASRSGLGKRTRSTHAERARGVTARGFNFFAISKKQRQTLIENLAEYLRNGK